MANSHPDSEANESSGESSFMRSHSLINELYCNAFDNPSATEVHLTIEVSSCHLRNWHACCRCLTCFDL